MWQAGVLAGCIVGGVALATAVAGVVLWKKCGPDPGAGKGKAAAYAVVGTAAGAAGGGGGGSGGVSEAGSAGTGTGTAVVAAMAAAAGTAGRGAGGYTAVAADLPPLSETRSSSASGYQVGRAVLCRTAPCLTMRCGAAHCGCEKASRTGCCVISAVTSAAPASWFTSAVLAFPNTAIGRGPHQSRLPAT